MKTPGRSSVLLMLQMLQLHYDDDYYELIEKIFKENNKERFLPEEYWLMAHGLMDEKGSFLNYRTISKLHGKNFTNWFIKVLEIMFPDSDGENASDK